MPFSFVYCLKHVLMNEDTPSTDDVLRSFVKFIQANDYLRKRISILAVIVQGLLSFLDQRFTRISFIPDGGKLALEGSSDQNGCSTKSVVPEWVLEQKQAKDGLKEKQFMGGYNTDTSRRTFFSVSGGHSTENITKTSRRSTFKVSI